MANGSIERPARSLEEAQSFAVRRADGLGISVSSEKALVQFNAPELRAGMVAVPQRSGPLLARTLLSSSPRTPLA